jgi:hypothetical protein
VDVDTALLFVNTFEHNGTFRPPDSHRRDRIVAFSTSATENYSLTSYLPSPGGLTSRLPGMADNRFVELILGPSVAKSTSEFAYKSLATSPQQLFSLFLRRDPAMEFASAFPLYAKRLADLLLKAPERFTRLGAKEKEKLLYEETVGAFIFTLLPWIPNDVASQEAAGDIVMAFVQTLRPERGGIELLGAELGRAPAVLTRLISSGHLASHTKKPFFDSLVLENWKSWGAVAGELSAKCDKHQQVTSRKEMIAFIQSFPCDQCSSESTESQTPLGRVNTHDIGNSTRVFENLLGERLGPWKMVISALAVASLKESVTEGILSVVLQSLTSRPTQTRWAMYDAVS